MTTLKENRQNCSQKGQVYDKTTDKCRPSRRTNGSVKRAKDRCKSLCEVYDKDASGSCRPPKRQTAATKKCRVALNLQQLGRSRKARKTLAKRKASATNRRSAVAEYETGPDFLLKLCGKKLVDGYQTAADAAAKERHFIRKAHLKEAVSKEALKLARCMQEKVGAGPATIKAFDEYDAEELQTRLSQFNDLVLKEAEIEHAKGSAVHRLQLKGLNMQQQAGAAADTIKWLMSNADH